MQDKERLGSFVGHLALDKQEQIFKNKRILCGHDMNLKLSVRMLCDLSATLRSRSLDLNWSNAQKTGSFRIMVLSNNITDQPDRITNQTALIRMRKERDIIRTIKTRKLSYFVHVKRNAEKYSLLPLVMQGKIVVKRGPGSRRASWLKNLRQRFD